MLVLSRKIGERLVIGDNITVIVSRVAGNRVTLGIEAPSEVRIIRGELKAMSGDGPHPRAAVGYHESADGLAFSLSGLAK
jgi:carbon storage regulator